MLLQLKIYFYLGNFAVYIDYFAILGDNFYDD